MVQTSTGKEAKRAEILKRAASVFRQKGFHGAGMREIARGLGLAPGALYYYFESKDDLLYACQMLSLKRLLSSAEEIMGSADACDAKLRRLIRSHLGHILDEMGGSFAHVEFHALDRARLTRVVSKRDAYERLVRRAIRDGIDAGLFKHIDVKIAALSLLGALNWAAVWWRPEGHENPAGVADQMADTFLQGWMR